MNKDRTRQLVNVIVTVITVAINALANALPINGQNTGEIWNGFQVHFVPAGYVFSIWGVIYLGLLAFAIYQALPAQGSNPHLRRIGYLYALSGVMNSLWILLWHYRALSADARRDARPARLADRHLSAAGHRAGTGLGSGALARTHPV